MMSFQVVVKAVYGMMDVLNGRILIRKKVSYA